MLTLQRINVFNFEGAFRGMRNPMASWDKSDGEYSPGESYEDLKYIIGPSDLILAQKLINSGSDHSKFLRQIFISMDITAPLYWWKEMDTYKVGTTANSESTMHRLAKTPITIECFSFDRNFDDLAMEPTTYLGSHSVYDIMSEFIYDLERLRKSYLVTEDPMYWRALIQMLPCSWNQMRTWTADYAVLRNIYTSRRNHKLSEWVTFCEEIEKLPYAKELITFGVKE